MDIDDNDVQDQNLQLGGEGSSKVSPVLNVYALPKFEFDYNLNGHIRFDNLVENEVFLGITNQENNHWIEEYSSVVESRRKNVWSEATSSESVEMLLKSVGQDEKVVEEIIIEELDTCDRRVSLNTIMDPNFQETFVRSKVSLDYEQSHPTFDTLESQSQKIDIISNDFHQEASNVDASVDECQENLHEFSERSIENADDVAKNFDSSEPDYIINNEVNTVVETFTYSVENLSVGLDVESEDKQPVEDSIPDDEGPTVSLAIDSFDMKIDDSFKQSEFSNSAVSDSLISSKINEEDNVNLHEKAVAVSPNSGFLETQAIEETDTKSEIYVHNLSVEETEIAVGNDGKSDSLISSKISQKYDDCINEESIAVSSNSGFLETQAIEETDTKSEIYVHNHSVEETEIAVENDGKSDSLISSKINQEDDDCMNEESIAGFLETQAIEDTDTKSEIHSVEETEKVEGSEIKDVGKTSLPTEFSGEMHAADALSNNETVENSDLKMDSNDENQVMQLGDETGSLDSNNENQIMQVVDETQSFDPDVNVTTNDQDPAFNETPTEFSGEIDAVNVSSINETVENSDLKAHSTDSNDENQIMQLGDETRSLDSDNENQKMQVVDETQSFDPDVNVTTNDQDPAFNETPTEFSGEMHAVNVSSNNETVENSDSKAYLTDSNDENQIMQLGDETQSLDSDNENQTMQVVDETRSIDPDVITNDQDPAFNEISTEFSGEMHAANVLSNNETVENSDLKAPLTDSNDENHIMQLGDEIGSLDSNNENQTMQVVDETRSFDPDVITNDQDPAFNETPADFSGEMHAANVSSNNETVENSDLKAHLTDSNDENQIMQLGDETGSLDSNNENQITQVVDETQSLDHDVITNDQDPAFNEISTEFSGELHAANVLSNNETVENSDLKAHLTDSNDDNQIMQVVDETQSFDPDVITNEQDPAFNEIQDAKLVLDYKDMEIDVVAASNSQKNVEIEPSLTFEDCEGVIAVGQESGSNMVVLTDAVADVESSKISSPETIPTTDVVNEDQPSSPILGVSLLHNNNEEKVEIENAQKRAPQVDNTVNCALDTVSEDAEKAVHEPAGHSDPSVGNLNVGPIEQKPESVETLNVGPNEQITESVENSNVGSIEQITEPVESLNVVPNEQITESVENLHVGPSEQTKDEQVSLKCLNRSPNLCDSSPKEGDNVDEGDLVVPKESVACENVVEPLNLAVNTSDEHQATVDVAGSSEREINDVMQNEVNMTDEQQASVDVAGEINHMVQSESGSVSLEKPQSLSLSDTKNIETSQNKKDNENSPLSKVDNDKDALQTVSSSSLTKEETCLTFEVKASPGQNFSLLSASSGGTHLDPVKLHEDVIISPQPLAKVANDKDALQTVSSNNLTKEEKGFTSKVKSSPDQKFSLLMASSGGTQLDPINLHEDTIVSPQPPANETGTKKISERKPRRKSVGKETAKKGSNLKDKSPAIGHVTPVKDLNNSISQFHLSFTDNQQVQLRAQILVYGSLISGMPPEEPHMFAAFGQSGGARRAWETVWHACLERVRGQTSQVNNPNTPKQSRIDLGNKDSDRGIKIGSAQSKVIASPIVSPMVPIPSPLWNISTPCDGPQSSMMHPTLSSLHPYQTQRAGHNPSWLSHGPFPGPWVASSPIAPFNARFSALPVTESVKLTTIKEPGAAGPPVVTVGHSPGPTVSSGPLSLSNVKKSMVLSGQPSSESKSRKRKKVIVSQAEVAMATPSAPAAHSTWVPQNQISFLSQNQTNSDVIKTPVSFNSERNLGQLSSVDRNTEKTVIREEMVSKIEESKVQAADAAVQAASAVSHCQNVWSQLATQKNSGLISENEAKLASSAVSIAAAASVAKVAAFAAKIASNVAEQARLMADEVFKSNKTENNDQTAMISHDKANPIISAAKEAARRRIEAASTASKHAENLDAIVKAAELAAEAVSQAGKIVALTNPLTLTELVESGPDSYWKTPQSANLQGGSDKQNVETTPNDKDKSIVIENDKSAEKGHKGSDLEFESVHPSDSEHNVPESTSGPVKDNIIKEGCLVEVYKDDNKHKGAWFAANVLNIKDGKAFVCYTEIQSDEGKLKEWVPLEVEGTGPPKIRIAHPMTTMQFEGNRKRGRTVLTDYSWCSGDRVDVWVHNCWCEGVVVETNKIDLTSLTVQFPAQEKMSVVRSWHIRPTLIWNDEDDKWIEWSSLKRPRSSEGDTPNEKRQKFVNPNFSISVDLVESGKHQEPSSFNIGKSSKIENMITTHKTMKSGLQKERSRVVFGVPKRGKKQKFMDPNDSVKPISHIIPGGSKNDSRKQPAEEKSKLVQSRKPPVPLVKQLTRKDKSKPSKPVSRDAGLSDGNSSGQRNRMDFGSSSSTDDVKEISSSKTVSQPQRLNKRKIAPDDMKSTKVEFKEKSTSELEPRRSNRKIQPTSRLLEGLQSSLSVSKIPTFSHARNHKVTPKGSMNSGS